MAIDGRNGSRGMNQEDTTATEVFQELRENERGDIDVVFEEFSEETPEEVMARADEPDPEPTVEEDLRPDEDELESLLLPGREMEQGFLWVIADGGL